MPTILLNKKNLFHNLDLALNKTKHKDKIAAVLKDNAYGHGLIEMASMLKEYGIKKAVVRTVDDANKIKDFFEYIVVLADTLNHTYSHTFHIAVNSLCDLEKLPQNTNIHVKIDSGMHRNGIRPNELEALFDGALKRKLNITGVFTHFKSADELSSEYFYQKDIFYTVVREIKNICEKLFIPIPAVHSCNSAGLFRTQNFIDDFARVGIAMYGYLEVQPPLFKPDLKPVLSLQAKKLSTRKVTKGERIGYGGTYTVPYDMEVSTYDIGYGDGFLRLNERKKYFTPNGCEILGRVSMDCVSINSTQEEIIIFDDASPLAKVHDTITYEITTSLKPHIKKTII